MSSPVIRITADDNGQISLDVIGATGQQCLALTAPLEQALGTVASRDAKPEAYEQNTYLQEGA